MLEQIGPYRVEERLGSGGMGEVYRAYDEMLDRRVAIKLIHMHQVSLSALKRFRREARMVAQLSHPSIVQIYHIERFEGDDCIVMEYVEGETLARRLRRGPLTLPETLALGRQIADGLAEAHDKGIVHRDLKPENVMLTAVDADLPVRAKILDFGLARPQLEEDPDSEATPENTLVGTPASMSPEQVHYQSADHRSDLFAFGTLLYHAATGRSPFAGKSSLEILHHVCHHQPLPADEVNPEVPAELARLISRLQEKRQGDRPQHAHEVSAELAEIARKLSEATAEHQRPPALHGERRQITVLRCLLHASEEKGLAKLVRWFNRAAAQEVRRARGRVRAEDDGVRACFGYPSAREDAARAAVEVAWEILATFADDLEKRRPATVLRAAVHTGVVVVPPESRNESPIFGDGAGDLWELADELAGCAAPGSLVTSDVTRQLVDRDFVCRAQASLRSGDGEVRVYRVENRIERRGDAAQPGIGSLVGRRRELGLLAERWRLAEEGRGQIVLLSGESGVGKTHLVWALREHLGLADPSRSAAAAPVWLACRGSQAFVTSALRPVVSLLWQVLGTGRRGLVEENRVRLEEMLAVHGLSGSLPLFTALLGLADEEEACAGRRRTLEAVVELILHLAAERPRLWVLDDLHWVDPSTLELLTLLLEQVPTARLLVVLAFRPRFELAWGEPSYLTRLHLNPLRAEQVEELIARRSGGRLLPGDLVARMVELADGVPLFAEELTRYVLESDLLDERRRPGRALAVPTSLADALMARLDRLGPSKQVAQLGAVFGRDFPYEMLAALTPFDEATLRSELDRLVDAEIFYRRGLHRIRYVFQHPLIQQAAYESLPDEKRREYHARIARVLEGAGEPAPGDAAETASLHPEIVAYHYTQAGLLEEAVLYWLHAGRKSHARDEAIERFRRGLRLLGELPETAERHQLEDEYRSALRTAQTS